LSQRSLHISPDLSLPLAAVTSTIVVYGGKGMGKTNLGAVVAEECAKAGLRWSVIDPGCGGACVTRPTERDGVSNA
jgi:polynucleotide 5'-kinase involved in rRNA processing